MPADIGASSWSETDASNNSTPPGGWPSGMLPNQVEPTARAGMGATKRWYNKLNAVYTTGGTSTAYTITSSGTAEAAYYSGQLYSFVVNATCGSAPTLNIDGLGAANLRKYSAGAWANLAAGDITANQVVVARYNGTQFDIVAMALSVTDFLKSNVANTYTATQTLSGAALNETSATLICQPTLPIGAAAANYILVTAGSTSTVTITIASPAVVTWASHGLPNNAQVVFTTTGALPTGLTAGTTYYVINGTTNTFQVSTTSGGSAINTSGSQSGTQTATAGSTITQFDTIQAGTERTLEFANAVTLTYDGTKLILPTGATISAAAGDTAIFRSEGSGNWRCVSYLRASGAALTATAIPTKAWCIFDGTSGSPSVTAGLNVTSITKNGTGDYTITFTSALSDANYAVSGSVNTTIAATASLLVNSNTSPTTTAVRIVTTANNAAADFSRVSVVVTR